MEQITYLLFIKRLDELQTLEERKAATLQIPIERRIFPKARTSEGGPTRTCAGRASSPSSLGEMFDDRRRARVSISPELGGEGSAFGQHMKDARLGIPTPALLAKAVEKLDEIRMDDRDTKGDVYEYMLGKIASAGQNGQFRTPRHIIKLMVEMTKPTPDVICGWAR